MKQLTLGVLTFNNSKYLQELLNSIENQTDRNFNLLIINNGSKDNSYLILDKFKQMKHDYPIQVLSNIDNSGSFLGTKQLFLQTTTDYLCIIHGDDLLKNNYVETANCVINSNPDISAFNFDLEEIEGHKNVLTGNTIRSNWTKFKIINRLMVSGLNPGVMPGAIINLSKIGNHFLDKENKGFNLNGTEDIFLWQQIIRSSGKILQVPTATYFYRRHSSQVSKNFNTYGASLGYARKINFLSCGTKFEKLLCVSEISYEFSTVNFNLSYLEGLGHIVKYKMFSIFRIINVFIRRTANFINYITFR